MTGQQYLTAHHEAGHAVAALIRGEELTSITINPTPERLGYTGYRGRRWDEQFVTYAGPWAEARALWAGQSLDGEDDDGYDFEIYVIAAWLRNHDGDGDDYQRQHDAHVAMFGKQPQRYAAASEAVWSRELEYHWPAIRTVAQMLLDGCTDVDAITAAVEATPWA